VCRYTKEFQMTNTSEIPWLFLWRVDNGSCGPDEFNIIPDRGSLLPGGHQTIRLEFISKHVCTYSAELILDMPTIQERAMVVPILGECVVPKLQIPHDTLDFGDCFLHFPSTQKLTLINDAKLPAKFIVEPQGAAGAALAKYSCNPSEGAIVAQGVYMLWFAPSFAQIHIGVCAKTKNLCIFVLSNSPH
jgi:hydrocephalus-inducing protein